ncbi:uncharacterized protein LOC125011097 [Mugil cephalus]|uniref:uncharacterized protein LOC125011097 n=1 Tax=Mugil cephalus TaxID=48193 RepID=UPI001FB741CA|nr:uncharacterized protein LOC125011097 [Mugil cephalus]
MSLTLSALELLLLEDESKKRRRKIKRSKWVKTEMQLQQQQQQQAPLTLPTPATWDEATEGRLISMIQERPALYDVTLNLYSNRELKSQLWHEIENQLFISEKKLRKRWESLRTQYARYKKMASCGTQKTGRQEWILSRLQFLEANAKRKCTTSELTIKEPSTAPDSYEASDGASSNTGNSTPETESKPSSPMAWQSTICGAKESFLHNNTATWNEETEGKLISMVQERPALYDIAENLYSNREVKMQLWHEIENKLFISEERLRKRWDSLRTQYIRYKRQAPLGVHKTGRQEWILARLQFLEPHTKRKGAMFEVKEPSTAPDSCAPSDGTGSDPWTPVKHCFFEAEPRPSSPMAESAIYGAEEPLPMTSSQSSLPKHQSMSDGYANEEPTISAHTICNTSRTLASQEDCNDTISAYCKDIERKMRKLSPNLLLQFQQEVDSCLSKYL